MSPTRSDTVLFDQVEKFSIDCRGATNEMQFKKIMEAICDVIGFKYFALAHHVDFCFKKKGAVVIYNYPDIWVEEFVEKNMFVHDPVHRACRTTNIGFPWTQVTSMIKYTSEDADTLKRAKLAGIADGFTVPANVPGEPNGSCSFATPTASLKEDQRHLAQLIGAFAFEAARRLARARTRTLPEKRPLTQRQRECLALVACGKTDWEISRILGVSHDTVIQHLKAAKERYGVTKRVPLAVKALYDGSISFAEVLQQHTHFWE